MTEFLLNYARKGTVAAAAAAGPVLGAALLAVTQDGSVSGAELVTTVGAVLGTAVGAFFLVFKTSNK